MKPVLFFVALALLFVGFGVMVGGALLIDYVRYGWGYNEQRTLDYYSEDGVSLLDSIQYFNHETSDGAVVLTYFEEKTYLLDREVILGDPFYNTQIDYDAINSSQDFCELWQQLEVDYLLIGKGWERWETDSYVDNYDAERLLPLLAQAMMSHTNYIFETSHHIILKVNDDCGVEK
jgi:hypothetical protein